MTLALEPFRVEVPDATLEDLRERLARARLPNQVAGTGWAQGTDRAFLEDLVDYWRDGYDWRRVEGELNRYQHVRTTVDGQTLHALHARAGGPTRCR